MVKNIWELISILKLNWKLRLMQGALHKKKYPSFFLRIKKLKIILGQGSFEVSLRDSITKIFKMMSFKRFFWVVQLQSPRRKWISLGKLDSMRRAWNHPCWVGKIHMFPFRDGWVTINTKSLSISFRRPSWFASKIYHFAISAILKRSKGHPGKVRKGRK